MTAALEGGKWSAARPGRTLPPGKTRYPLYRRLGGPQGRSGRAENVAPPGFDPRIVQPVAQSLYRLSYPAHNHVPSNIQITTKSTQACTRDVRYKANTHEGLSMKCSLCSFGNFPGVWSIKKPTFRNSMSVPSSWAIRNKLQTPGKFPKEHRLQNRTLIHSWRTNISRYRIVALCPPNEQFRNCGSRQISHAC